MKDVTLVRFSFCSAFRFLICSFVMLFDVKVLILSNFGVIMMMI
jgi:hypothetical protein